MTQMEVVYLYGSHPGEREMRALDALREVYGIRKLKFDRDLRQVRVEYDASRFKEPVVAAMLRRAGIDLREQKILA
ncbi:MAG: hypothetical protein H0X25_07895 [Acidobacteriales bacterium]|nr:hypothetical protein [Terriglobales bacterium]